MKIIYVSGWFQVTRVFKLEYLQELLEPGLKKVRRQELGWQKQAFVEHKW